MDVSFGIEGGNHGRDNSSEIDCHIKGGAGSEKSAVLGFAHMKEQLFKTAESEKMRSVWAGLCYRCRLN
jgi:hypothetical protein